MILEIDHTNKQDTILVTLDTLDFKDFINEKYVEEFTGAKTIDLFCCGKHEFLPDIISKVKKGGKITFNEPSFNDIISAYYYNYIDINKLREHLENKNFFTLAQILDILKNINEIKLIQFHISSGQRIHIEVEKIGD